MSGDLVWPILCLAAGLTLLIVEVFVPSGGVIGFLAAGLLIVSLWLAFTNTPHGWMFVFAEAVLLPMTLMLALYLWPRSPLARFLLLRPPHPEEIEPEPVLGGLYHLVGQYGRALTPLRPSGVVDFEGKRIDGLAEEGLIPAGTLVRAIAVRGPQLVVRVETDLGLDQIGT
jgi:membrane-bound ClpP family serine protease